MDVINPETGAWSKYKTFSSEDTQSCSFTGFRGHITDRLIFNNDFTKMAASLRTEDEEDHIGWIDEKGQFTDVTKLITKPDGFETSIVRHKNPYFDANEYLFFTEEKSDEKKVPIDNLSSKAVINLSNGDMHDKNKLVKYPDGTYKSVSGHYYYDDTMNSETDDFSSNGLFIGWVSPSTYLSGDESELTKVVMEKMDDGRYLMNYNGIVNRGSKWTSETLFKSGERRTCESYKLSPDKSEVAFLSRLTTGADQAWYLYKVSVGGGEPVKISTDYKFDDNCKIIDWN